MYQYNTIQCFVTGHQSYDGIVDVDLYLWQDTYYGTVTLTVTGTYCGTVNVDLYLWQGICCGTVDFDSDRAPTKGS